MSFRTNNSTGDDVPQPGGKLQFSRSRAAEPLFRPQLVRSVRMHPLIAAGVAAAVLVALLGYALTMKQSYVAISQVYEEPASTKLLGDAGAAFDATKYDTFLGEQMQLAQRLDVLKAALDALPKATWAEYGPTAQSAAENIQALLKVQRVASSYQISISLKGSDAAKTADVVNAVVTAYLDAVHKANAADSDQRAQLLAEERQRIESELQSERTEQATLGESIGMASPGTEGGNPYDTELSGVRAQLSEARAAHDVAAAQLAALSGAGPSPSGGLSSGLAVAADEAILGDAGLGSMKATVSTRKAQLNGQMAGMTPSNPIYKQDQDEIADLDRTLDRMTQELRDRAARHVQDKLRSDLQRTGDVESRLNAELSKQIARATSAAPRLQRATEVAGDMQRLTIRLTQVDDAMRSLRMEQAGPAQVRLSLAATAPEHPEANRRKMLLLAAFPLALLCGAFAAVLARKQDTRIYGGIDIEDQIGFPPLAILPARADVPERVYEEYVLRLAAGIESAYRSSGARTFLLTAVSLSTDIAPLASALKRKFEEIGVNLLVATAQDMLAPTEDIPTEPLDVRRDSPSLMRRVVTIWSEGFVAANVAQMKTAHGLVLIESEALLNSAQTEYVARCVDATILMIECGVTTRKELQSATELLERLNVHGVGAVLEEMQLRFAESGFREAIEAVDRRQSEMAPVERRTTIQAREPEVVAARADYTRLHEAWAPAAEESLAAEPLADTRADYTRLHQVWQPVAEEPVAEVHELVEHEAEPVIEAAEPVHAEPELAQPVIAAEVAEEPVPVVEEPVVAEVVETPLVESVPELVESVPEHVAEPDAEEVEEAPIPEEIPEPVMMPALEHVMETATGTGPARRGFAGDTFSEGVLRPVLVDRVGDAERRYEEKRSTSPLMSIVERPLHEKMAPKLSARQEDSRADGDPGMTRKTSWLGRLLGRNSEPVVSILPDYYDDEVHAADDEEQTHEPEAVAQAPAPVEQPPSRRFGLRKPASISTNEDDYDLPMVTRLEQISRQRPAAPAYEPVPTATRFQIVPPEFEDVAEEFEPHFPEATHEFAAEAITATHEEQPAAEVVEAAEVAPYHEPVTSVLPVRIPTGVTRIVPVFDEPAFVAPVAMPVAAVESIAPVAAVPEPVPAPVVAPRGPGRPLTFHQLSELAEQRQATASPAPVEVAEPLPEPEVVAELVPVEEAIAAPVHYEEPIAEEAPAVEQPWEPVAEVPAPEPVAAEPSYEEPVTPEPVLAEPEHAPPVEVAYEPAAEPVHVSFAPMQPLAEPDDSWMEMSSPSIPAYVPNVESGTRMVAESSEAESNWAEPVYHSPLRTEPFWADAEEDVPVRREILRQPEPMPVPAYESDDIQPVYEEASRHLTTGRWDPIPPLRPALSGWRDRPVPTPQPPVERRRWTGIDEDMASPPQRWMPEAAATPPPTEPLPEPLLTRQWGLLSRFQQARNSSSRPVAETDSDPAAPVPPNGNRQN